MKSVSFLSLKDVNGRQQGDFLATMGRVLSSGWYLNGEQAAAFEAEFADFTGARYCVGVGNGLDALTLILLSMKQLEPWADGDEVIVPAFTFIATAQAVSRAGLRPVFADVGADFLIDPNEVGKLLTERTRAIMPVHLYGCMADMGALRELAADHGLKLIEDAAQAHGAGQNGLKAGNAADAAAFSFYPGKNLGALGDGGAVTTNDEQLAKRVRTLANYGAERKYYHDYLGLNSRLDELQAAVLRLKLQQLNEDNARRQHIAAMYSRGISNPHVATPYGGDTSRSVFHIYPVLSEKRDALQQHLAAHGVETLCHYPLTVPAQAAYKPYNSLRFPRAEYMARHELSLPMSPTLTGEDVQHIIHTINHFNL